MNDYIQGEKFMALANNWNVFYSHTHDVNNILSKLSFTTRPFVLISHNSDGCIMKSPTRKDCADTNFIPPNLIHWFGQNVNSNDSRISSIPIGLENNKWMKVIPKIDLMTKQLMTDRKVRNLVYMNHNVQTNPGERGKIYKLFEGKSWVTSVHGVNFKNYEDYLNNLYNHQFVICPDGHGIDTHRTWEALYMGVIPIVKKGINSLFYKDLPICFVNDWEDINENFLRRELRRIELGIWNMDMLNFSYWKEQILSYVQ